MQLPSLDYMRLSPAGLIPFKPLGIETKLLILEAQARGLFTEIVTESDVICISDKTRSSYIQRRNPDTNHVPGPRICDRKDVTRAFLQRAGLSVTSGYRILSSDTPEYRQSVFDTLQKPLVIKPTTRSHGLGIKLGIQDAQTYHEWLNFLFSDLEKPIDSEPGIVLVEETARGEEYRILATQDKVLAVMNRQPASVMGDGVSSIAQLIATKNLDPIRNIDQGLYPHIQLDQDMLEVLQRQGLTPESVPAKDQKITLRLVSNIMAGGDAVDVTDLIHPSVAEIAVRTTNALPGMTFIGIDFMTTDITADQRTQKYNIIEVNSAPEFAMHDIPMIGTKRNIAQTLIQMMFPEVE